MNVVIRGYKRRALIFQQKTQIPDDFEKVVGASVVEHVQAMNEGSIGMIEIEFVDAPENQRFLRLGVEPDGMVLPVAIKLD